MGLAQTEHFRRTLRISGDDASAVRLVIERRVHPELADDAEALEAAVLTALQALGSHSVYDWSAHEREARALFLDIARSQPAHFARVYLVEKPLAAARFAALAVGLGEPYRDTYGRRGAPTMLLPLIIVTGAAFLIGAAAARRGERFAPGPSALLLLALLPASLLPWMLIYVALMTMAGTIAVVVAGAGLAAFAAGNALGRRLPGLAAVAD